MSQSTNEPDPQESPMWVEHQIGNSKWMVYPNVCEQDDNGNWVTSWNVEHPTKGSESLCSALAFECVEDSEGYEVAIPKGIMIAIAFLANKLSDAEVY